MTLQRQVAFWIGVGVALGLTLFLLRDMLLPFVAALALAYMLNPIANRLERIGLSRALATFLILLVVLVIFVVALIVLIPLLGNQLIAFVRAIPGYVTALHSFALQRLREMHDNPVANYLVGRMGNSSQDIGQLVSQGAGWIGTFIGSLWSGGQTLVSILSLIVVSPIVAFYILVDWPRMLKTIDAWLPLRQADTIRHLAGEIDKVVATFIRGQASVCLALAIFYGVSLTTVGLNFGLLIGFSAGLFSFIPYVGSFVGFVVAMVVGVVQFWPDWLSLGTIAAVFVAGQILDGYVLQPRLVGSHVGLHPVWLMFSLFAFGSLFGFVGTLMAVPLAASTGVLLRFALERYRQSALYTGSELRAVEEEVEIVTDRPQAFRPSKSAE